MDNRFLGDISCKRRRVDSELRIPDESRHFWADAISRAQRTALSRISSTLTPRQQRLFERTYFGSFLHLPETKFCGILVHAFLLRQLHPPFARDEFWFRISGVDVRFSPFEFVLVTGLSFSRRTDVSSYIPRSSGHRIRSTYFRGCSKVQYHDIERVFLSRAWGDDDIDAVKLALLYILHMVLLGNDRRKKVSTEYLQLVDHLDGFNSYPWGVVVWQMTYDSMSQTCERLCSGRMQEIRKYDLYGFPFAFQYWIYETLETLHEWIDLVDLYVSPRMLRWLTRDVPVWTHIGRIFTGDPTGLLHPRDILMYP
ncbi:uncharacterized protein LOC123192149 [Mangifera indica]|uniref:uncharacterized protein LOC123192149 n=1 Tax=Mangifera indica TaxID=29780 RepID=UPI001CFAE162|nr:uncharacterized protein LOC123192149 [Mangifera indica]